MEQNLLANLHIQLHESAEIEEDLDDHQDRIKVGNNKRYMLTQIPHYKLPNLFLADAKPEVQGAEPLSE